jgi:hypothetical protein
MKIAIRMLAALACLAPAARAADITIDCNRGQSLRAAVLSLSLEGPNSITVHGTCHESHPVAIFLRERLTIQDDGAGAAVVAADHGRPAINIVGSQNIFISGFDISGGRNGVNVTQSRRIELDNCKIHDNARNGLVVNSGAELDFSGGAVSHNARNGVVVAESRLGIDTVEIAANGSGGLGASDASSVMANALNVHDNAGTGVIVFHVSDLNLGGSTITGNGSTGLRISETSHGEIFGNVIRNNGRADGQGGVYVSEKGEIFLDGPNDISNNAGHGVRGTAGAAISGEGSNTISGNSGDGIRLDRGSFEQFFAADSFSGNGKANIRCDNTSFIAGDPGTRVKVFCKRAAFEDDDDGGEGEGHRRHAPPDRD